MSCCHGGNNININMNNFNQAGRASAQGQQKGGLGAIARRLADPLGILPKGLNPFDVATNTKNPLNPINMLNPLSPLKALGLFG